MLFTDCHIKVVELLLTAAASVETKDKLGYDPRAGRRGEVSKGNDASASGVDEIHRVTPLKSYIYIYDSLTPLKPLKSIKLSLNPS